jgi:KaiC/GvpD/RAD55 family RecA-like ATPase
MQFLIEDAIAANASSTWRCPRPPTNCAPSRHRTAGPSTASSCSSCRRRRTPLSSSTLYRAAVELATFVQALLAIVDRLRPSRIVLDSLSELKLLARDPLRFRRQILALKSYFAGMDTTVLLLDDQAGGEDSQLQSLSHGVLLLEQLPFEYGRARRRLRIVKFRGVAATEGFHDFTINRGGIAVFPQIEPPGQCEVSPQPVESGIAEMDRLLGGGLAWGTTTLFIGPSGSGKSTLATQYISHAGEPASIYLFDERMPHLPAALRRARHAAVGADRERTDQGLADRARPALARRVQPPGAARRRRVRRPHDPHRQHQRLPARHPAERRAAGAGASCCPS